MAKTNYQYEKRARELAKKAKKEEKLKRRQEHATRPEGGDAEGEVSGDDQAPVEEGPEAPQAPK